MRLLLIDTCGPEGTVALADTTADPAVVATKSLPGRSSSERLVPVVGAMLEARRWSLSDLAAIVVVNGPGSFTGVRVGLSAAKGWSEASQVPLVAISRLATLAALSCEENPTTHQPPIRVALDAGRGEFYYGEYEDSTCLLEALLTQEELKSRVGSATLVVCETRTEEALSSLALKMVAEPRAEDALELAVNCIERGRFEDAGTIDANYLRRTDAQLFAGPSTR